MKYLVKVDAGAGKVETYATEATDAAAAMLQAYDKYGVCGVTVSPAEDAVILTDERIKEIYRLRWVAQNMDCEKSFVDFARDIEAEIKSAATACPVDTAIANLDALLAERRASTMDHAQLAALGRETAPVAGEVADWSVLADRLNEIDRHLAKCRYTESHEARRLVYSMLRDVCGSAAPRAPGQTVASK